MNHEADSTAFPSNWRDVLNEMQREWDRLHSEIGRLRTERDQLSRALVALLGDEVHLSEEEILAQIGREKPLREFLQELRGQLVGD